MPEAAVASPPEAPPAAAPSAPSSATPNPALSDADAYATLDSFIDAPANPQASAASEKIDTKPSEQKPPTEQKKPEDTNPPETAPTNKPVKAKTLAEAKEMAQAEAKEWRQKHNALQKQFEELQKAPPKANEEVANKLAELEKRYAQAQDDLKYVNYEATQDYAEKNNQFLTAYQKGRAFVERLEIVERKEQFTDPQTGEARERVVQQARPATAKDFDSIMRHYNFDPPQASKLANQLFGEMSPDVKDYMRDTQRLFESREAAAQEYRSKAVERQKALGEATTRAHGELQKAFNESLELGVKKWPDRYGPKDGDSKGNELLTKAMELAQRAFTDGKSYRDGQKDLSPQELARLRGAIVNQAGAYPRAMYWLNQANSRIKELEEKMSQYEASEPGPAGGKRQPSTKTFANTMTEVLDSMGSIATPN